MKNKDKYDLRELRFNVDYMLDGCGKVIRSTRRILIYYKGKLIHSQKEQTEALIYVMKWLEKEEE